MGQRNKATEPPRKLDMPVVLKLVNTRATPGQTRPSDSRAKKNHTRPSDSTATPAPTNPSDSRATPDPTRPSEQHVQDEAVDPRFEPTGNHSRPLALLNPIRVLDTVSGQFVEIYPESDNSTVYAILSHTWDLEGEQTYEELKSIQLRYASEFQTQQDVGGGRGKPEGNTLSSPKQDQVPRDSSLTQLAKDSEESALEPHPQLAEDIKQYIQLEVQASLGPFLKMYGPLQEPAPASASIHDKPKPELSLEVHQDEPSSSSPPPPQLPVSEGSFETTSLPATLEHLTLSKIWDDRELSPKIRKACFVARKNGYRYIWIDSCCIDKSSSSELSEAINSMYKWYSLAAKCYVYLTDVPTEGDHYATESAFRTSRWFRRGWTLQELLAPFWVEFLSKDWIPIGSKHALLDLIEDITNISHKALLKKEPLDAFSVAQRFSWAVQRETKRKEDRAYSLLGIFNIIMPTLYGEGDRAFRRLQEQIMQHIPDQSLFAWGHVYQGPNLSSADTNATSIPKHIQAPGQEIDPRTTDPSQQLFAISLDSFRGCEGIRTTTINSTSSQSHSPISYTPTPYGISTQFRMVSLTHDLLRHITPSIKDVQLDLSDSPYLAILQCDHKRHPGHLLGRVCYLTRSNDFDGELVFTGSINVKSQGGKEPLGPFDLFLLSPKTFKDFCEKIEPKTVYIPHPGRDTVPQMLPSSIQNQTYTSIKLQLLRETRDALQDRRYSVKFHRPDNRHPTTHKLTLSKEKHTVCIEFQHTLHDRGRGFTIKITTSGSRVQLNPIPDSDLSWSDKTPWRTELPHIKVPLSVAEASTLTMDLGLDFVGDGAYSLSVNIEPAEDQAAEGRTGDEQILEPRGDLNTTEAGQEDGGHQDDAEIPTASGETRDGVATTTDHAEDRDDLYGHRLLVMCGDYIAAQWVALFTVLLNLRYMACEHLHSVFGV